MRYKKRHIRMFNNPSTPVLLLPPAVQPLFAFSAAFAYNIAVKVNLYDKVLVVVRGPIRQRVHIRAIPRDFSE